VSNRVNFFSVVVLSISLQCSGAWSQKINVVRSWLSKKSTVCRETDDKTESYHKMLKSTAATELSLLLPKDLVNLTLGFFLSAHIVEKSCRRLWSTNTSWDGSITSLFYTSESSVGVNLRDFGVQIFTKDDLKEQKLKVIRGHTAGGEAVIWTGGRAVALVGTTGCSAVSDDGYFMADSCPQYGNISVTCMSTAREFPISRSDRSVETMIFLPTINHQVQLACGHISGMVEIFKLQRNNQQQTMQMVTCRLDHTCSIQQLIMSHCRKFLISQSVDSVYRWDIDNKFQFAGSIRRTENDIVCAGELSLNRFLVSTKKNGLLMYCMEAEQGEPVAVLRVDNKHNFIQNTVLSMLTLPDDTLFVVGHDRRDLYQYHFYDGR